MSIYAATASQGVSSLNLMMGGKDATTIAAYNTAYSGVMKRFAAADAINAAEANISAINQDKILTNLSIEMSQQDAQAQLQVNAAAAGVHGGSVDAASQMIDVNATTQRMQIEAEAENLTEQQLAGVYSASLGMSSIPEVQVTSPVDVVLSMASQVEASDFGMGAPGEGGESAFRSK